MIKRNGEGMVANGKIKRGKDKREVGGWEEVELKDVEGRLVVKGW